MPESGNVGALFGGLKDQALCLGEVFLDLKRHGLHPDNGYVQHGVPLYGVQFNEVNPSRLLETYFA